MSFAVLGVQLDGLPELGGGLGEAAFAEQGGTQVVMGVGVVRTKRESLLVVGDGFVEAAGLGQGDAQAVVDNGVLRVLGEDAGEAGDSLLVLALVELALSEVDEAVELRNRRVDAEESVGGHVDELGDVHGAVGGGGVFDQNGRAVLTRGVDVGEEHLGVGRAALRGEDHPAAIRREAVPGVHQGRVGGHAARLAPFGRDNVELAVGAHQLAVAALDEDDPAAVR